MARTASRSALARLPQDRHLPILKRSPRPVQPLRPGPARPPPPGERADTVSSPVSATPAEEHGATLRSSWAAPGRPLSSTSAIRSTSSLRVSVARSTLPSGRAAPAAAERHDLGALYDVPALQVGLVGVQRGPEPRALPLGLGLALAAGSLALGQARRASCSTASAMSFGRRRRRRRSGASAALPRWRRGT